MTDFTTPTNAPEGTRFRLYGIALTQDRKRIGISYDERAKAAPGSGIGSTVVSRGWLDETFPATRTGEKKALLFVAKLNIGEAEILRQAAEVAR